MKIGAQGHQDREKWRPGVPPRGNKTRSGKKQVVPNSNVVPFFGILVENGSQDGGQNRPKIDKKSVQNFMFFLNGFLIHFRMDFGAKIEEKSMQKRCQKHVGIGLEVELAKT